VRTRYRNGDEIRLACGCNDCNPTRINGVLCHEQGCPSAWKDHARTCVECDAKFYSPHAHRKTCGRHS
jgi:hypothetical protein